MFRLPPPGPARNLALYPWLRFATGLLFWQAVWFLYFQGRLSASEAILLYVAADLTTTVLEVPSGYLSDRWGRRPTLLVGTAAGALGAALVAAGQGVAVLLAGQVLLGAGIAFLSGTDTAMLYQSLAALGRTNEAEAQELRGWRAHFTALAVSAVLGGLLARVAGPLAFALTALAQAAALGIVLMLREPPGAQAVSEAARLATLRRALRNPALRWLFLLAVLMYAWSHLPFVFGQPFIADALGRLGLGTEAPLVSGAVTTAMMLTSLLVSLAVPWLRQRVGVTALLLSAFAIQVGLVSVLAATGSVLAVAVLLLRMVPNAIAQPVLVARVQHDLSDESRATYLSMQSLAGRLVLSGSLLVAAGGVNAAGAMTHPEIARVLGWYFVAGLLALALLAVWAWRRGELTRQP